MIKELKKTKTGNQNGVTLRGTTDGYSLKINSIKGISKQETTAGNQLANITDGTLTINGITVVRNSGIVTVSGTPTNADGSYSAFSIGTIKTVKANTTYTTSIDSKVSGIGVAIGNTGGNLNLTMSSASKSISGKISSEMTNQAVVLNVSHSIGTINKSFRIMFNEGSSALEWELYTGGIPSPNPEYPQEIESCLLSEVKTVGKNKLKNTSYSRTISGVDFTVNNDDLSITANGTATADINFIVNSNFESKDGEKYKISGCPSGGSSSTYRLGIQNPTTYDAYWDYGNGNIFVQSKNVKRVLILIKSGTTISNLTFYPMIKKADIENDNYEPYKETSVTLSEPIELNGIRNVKDEVNLTSEIKKIHKMILDGSESWVYNTESDELIQFTCQLTKEAIGTINTSINKNKLMCSHFLVGNQLQKGIWIYNGITLAVVVEKTLASTASEWKTWLSNNNVTLLYELKEEIISKLSDEDTEKLIGFSTFNDVTYITTDSEIQPIIEAEYGVYKYKEWNAEDKYFNAEDYNRIISNINLVKSLADKLFHSMTDISMGEEKTYLSMIYAREMNNIEDALDIINLETYNFDIGNKQTFRANGNTPLLTEFDRIEKSCALIYEKLMEHKDLLPRLTIRLGN